MVPANCSFGIILLHMHMSDMTHQSRKLVDAMQVLLQPDLTANEGLQGKIENKLHQTLKESKLALKSLIAIAIRMDLRVSKH